LLTDWCVEIGDMIVDWSSGAETKDRRSETGSREGREIPRKNGVMPNNDNNGDTLSAIDVSRNHSPKIGKLKSVYPSGNKKDQQLVASPCWVMAAALAPVQS